MNYGSFDATDEEGNKYDKFNAGDYMLYIITSYNIAPKLNIGVSGKPIISGLEKYVSLGVLFDVGITYNDTAKLFSAGLVIKNFGFQIKPYTHTRESLPWSIDFGISKRLEHAPFRFHITYCDLQKFNLQYDSPIEENSINSFDKEADAKNNFEIFASNLFRHFVIAGELILSKNLYGVVSYDIRKRNELAFDTRSGMSGFSLGVGLKLSKFHFSYSYSPYNIAASTHFISLESNLGNILKGGKTKSISN
ncbi:MAG: type IX secretion system protein PorQ [Bacteroidales bacterium]|nr:type IX secretion system protein PorQ [Bacteroidales bacterium]